MKCSHPNPIETAAGKFCMACGQLLTKASPVKPAAKATQSASITGAKKHAGITNFHKTPAITKSPSAKPATKVKVDSVSTPLLSHKKSIISDKK